jgi:hypothetical protein
MFLIKKPIKITAYTYDKSFIVNAPPTIRSKEKPEWIKRLKAYITQWDSNIGMDVRIPTVNQCPAIKEFLTTPIMLNMWGDLDIKVFPDGRWNQYAVPGCNISAGEHAKIQFGEGYNNRLALKLNSPWFFVASEPTKFMFMESHYSTTYFRDNNILFPPGIIEYKNQHSTNVHLSVPIPKTEPFTLNLKLGMPLISMFPMTDRQVEIETKLVSISDWELINSHLPKVFIGRYFRLNSENTI